MSSCTPTTTDLITDRLVLRLWSTTEITAVIDDNHLPHWASDFPSGGDWVIAAWLTEHPEGLGSHGHRLIVERESGLLVGSIGLFWPPSDGVVELGYGIVESRRGRGYATEAARAVIAHAFTAPDVRSVQAEVDADNPASARVLVNAGLHIVDRTAKTIRFATTDG